MEINELIRLFQESIGTGNSEHFKEVIKKFLKEKPGKHVVEMLAKTILKVHYKYKSLSSASLLDLILSADKNLGYVSFPDNKLFGVALITGDNDLFDCYIKNFAEPFLRDNSEVENDGFYIELYAIAQKYDENLAKEEFPCYLGIDFSEPFAISNEYPGAYIVNKDDYDIMISAIEKLNAIVGRREILKKLDTIVLEM